jgi:hypothetical protein
MTPAERIATLRAAQAGPPMSIADVAKAFGEHLAGVLREHLDHPWEQVGRCVFCAACGARLYQGTIPEGHPVGRRSTKPARSLLAEFRDRWGLPS